MVNQCGINSFLSGLMFLEEKNKFISRLSIKPDFFALAFAIFKENDSTAANLQVFDFVQKHKLYRTNDCNKIDSYMTTASILKVIAPNSVKMSCCGCKKEAFQSYVLYNLIIFL